MLRSILIIDDSLAEHFLYKEVIQSCDEKIEVHQAYDGQEGLDMIVKEGISPDLIFLDINMPGLNGFEFLEQFESSEHRLDTNIIMLTSSSLDQDKERAFAFDSVTDYILKPLRVNDMQKIMLRA